MGKLYLAVGGSLLGPLRFFLSRKSYRVPRSSELKGNFLKRQEGRKVSALRCFYWFSKNMLAFLKYFTSAVYMAIQGMGLAELKVYQTEIEIMK